MSNDLEQYVNDVMTSPLPVGQPFDEIELFDFNPVPPIVVGVLRLAELAPGVPADWDDFIRLACGGEVKTVQLDGYWDTLDQVQPVEITISVRQSKPQVQEQS